MTKFSQIFELILEQKQNLDRIDKIITFASSQLGEKLCQYVKQQCYKQLDKCKDIWQQQFDDVDLQFDMYQQPQADVYGQVLPQQLNTIRINLFPFIEYGYYSQFNKNLNFYRMVNRILNGQDPNVDGPLIVHQLAHIRDFSNRKHIDNPHDQIFRDQFDDMWFTYEQN